MSTLSYDNLVLASSVEPETLILTLASGQDVVRGEVLAYNTSTGKVVTYASGGSNGTGDFYGIAVADTDAGSGDTDIVVYKRGTFNINALVFSGSGDSATQALINKAADLGCILKTALAE